ncbi:MAG: sulfite exporter TauE/SafE family protein [Phycisphaerales bacterium]
MPPDTLSILAALFLVVGALYAAVGHAGASGYLAVMAIMSVEPSLMRSTALTINVFVATIAFVQFARASHFRWSLFWPFAVASIPAAFLGGKIALPSHALKIAIGVVLLFTAIRMAYVAWRPHVAPSQSRPPHVPAMLAVGALLGFVAGLTGTGGGIFLSPVLLLLRWADPKRTAATSSLFIWVNSIAGVGGLMHDGRTPPLSLWPLAVCAVIGGLIGATLGSRRATPRALNVLLAVVLLVAGAKLVLG